LIAFAVKLSMETGRAVKLSEVEEAVKHQNATA
jgi:hypothetical protein